MSDEESFVILGSSPLSSLENDGVNKSNHSISSSLQSDTPGSRFSSLKNSQISDLQNAQEIATQTAVSGNPGRSFIKSIDSTDNPFSFVKSGTVNDLENAKEMASSTRGIFVVQGEVEGPIIRKCKPQVTQEMPSKTQAMYNVEPQMGDPFVGKLKTTSVKSQKSFDREQEISDSKLWNRQPQIQVEENVMPFSLEDCAVNSPLEQKEKAEENIKKTNLDENAKSASNSNKATPPMSVESNLATSFIMGEINADVLKTSVYSQFPSISMEACAEDVVKLQNMVCEYTQLKSTIKKANNTMKLFYNNSLQWKEKMNTIEEHYKQQLNKCQKEIEVLRKQNQELENSFKSQIEALEIARKKDREETVQEVSEKNALLENMRAQIIKLEKQQLASFEFVAQNQDDFNTDQFNKYYITRGEHELEMKKLERKLSEMLASNLDLKDMEKQYVDEINCLKVNLTAAGELIKENSGEIAQMQALDKEKQQQIQVLEKSLEELRLVNEDLTERISLLEHQNEVHRKDFEMEQESRQTAVKEKQQILHDLRNLQRKNQELIEEHQRIARSYEKKLSSASNAQITAAAAAAQTNFNNPQRPIMDLPTSTPGLPTNVSMYMTTVSMHMCPICNKAFDSLYILQSHVDDCIDKN